MLYYVMLSYFILHNAIVFGDTSAFTGIILDNMERDYEFIWYQTCKFLVFRKPIFVLYFYDFLVMMCY